MMRYVVGTEDDRLNELPEPVRTMRKKYKDRLDLEELEGAGDSNVKAEIMKKRDIIKRKGDAFIDQLNKKANEKSSVVSNVGSMSSNNTLNRVSSIGTNSNSNSVSSMGSSIKNTPISMYDILKHRPTGPVTMS